MIEWLLSEANPLSNLDVIFLGFTSGYFWSDKILKWCKGKEIFKC